MKEFSGTFYSPAKINLGITIPYRYSNGYHHIVTPLYPVSLFDILDIKISKASEGSFNLSWENSIPEKFSTILVQSMVFESNYKNNILYKTFTKIKSFLEKENLTSAAFHLLQDVQMNIHINKSIPSPCGLGGGSSNSAVLVKAILQYLKLNLSKKEFHNACTIIEDSLLSIGSDVPFFMHNKPALVSGIGKINSFLPNQITFLGILLIPDFGMETSQMYHSLNKPFFNQETESLIIRYGLKSSLQGDQNLYSSQIQEIGKYEKAYNLLIELLNRETKESKQNNILDVHSEFLTIMKQNEYDSVTMINSFMDSADILYPEKSKVIQNGIESATGLLNEELYKAGKKRVLINSLSGSGSASYVMFPLLQNENSDMFWGLIKNVKEKLAYNKSNLLWYDFSTLLN